MRPSFFSILTADRMVLNRVASAALFLCLRRPYRTIPLEDGGQVGVIIVRCVRRWRGWAVGRVAGSQLFFNPAPALARIDVLSKILLSANKKTEPRARFFVEYGAQEKTRTSTVLPPLGPEPSASTNSATWALKRCMLRRFNSTTFAVVVGAHYTDRVLGCKPLL